MILAFLESIKYVGHLWPISLFRMALGYVYLSQAIAKFQTGYLLYPYLNESVRNGLGFGHAPEWYRSFLENVVMVHWKIASYSYIGFGIMVGVSFLLGYLVRPVSFIALALTLHHLWLSGPELSAYFNLLLGAHLVMFMVGAGRCLGVDYYFYKSRRGLWW